VRRSAPPRSNSSIIFKKNAGDSSRAILALVIFASVAFLVAIFVFGKEPPKGLSEEPERHRLPKDLVEAAMKGKVADEPPAEAAPGAPTAAAAGASGPTAAGASGPGAAKSEEPGPAEPPKPGSLELKTEPQVDVYDGNTALGRTPFTAQLPAGVHKLRFTDGKSGINIYKQYRIAPGSEQRDQITFGTSTLSVLAPDGAQIFLNSRFLGKAPLEPTEIYEGRYFLKVSLDGRKWSEWFDAPAGRKIEYKVTLRAD
jgi:hypothetical protein